MDITVILCTYNRCEALAVALQSVAVSQLPTSVKWEVLVVDNNSNDQTRQVVTDFCRRYPDRFRYLFEQRPGKSNALNSGVRDARGEILVFMDDDVTVEATWLQNLTMSLADVPWVGAGGRVVREWTCPVPPWLSIDSAYARMGWPLVIFDLAQGAGELFASPCGTNMAFRKEMFVKYGGFRTDLGPQGNEIRSPQGLEAIAERIPRACEDREFGERLLAAGERLRYEPSAVVHHPVWQNRLTREYFLAWWFEFGRANIRMRRPKPPVWGMPRRVVRMGSMTIQALGRAVRWMLAVKPYKRFYYKVQVWETVGIIVEDYLQWSAEKDGKEWSARGAEAIELKPVNDYLRNETTR